MIDLKELEDNFYRQLIDVKELEEVLKTEKSAKVKSLHKLIFENEGDRKNVKEFKTFFGFLFEIEREEYEGKKIKLRMT